MSCILLYNATCPGQGTGAIVDLIPITQLSLLCRCEHVYLPLLQLSLNMHISVHAHTLRFSFARHARVLREGRPLHQSNADRRARRSRADSAPTERSNTATPAGLWMLLPSTSPTRLAPPVTAARRAVTASFKAFSLLAT